MAPWCLRSLGPNGYPTLEHLQQTDPASIWTHLLIILSSDRFAWDKQRVPEPCRTPGYPVNKHSSLYPHGTHNWWGWGRHMLNDQ